MAVAFQTGVEGVFRSLSACDIGKEWEGDRGRKRREKGVRGGISEECQQCSFCSSAFPPKGLSSSLQRGTVRERICSPLPRKAAWIVKAAEDSLWLGEKIVAGVPKRVHGRACFFFKENTFVVALFLSLRPVCYHHRCQRREHFYLCKYYGGLREECARVSLPLSVCKEFIALLLMKIFFGLFSSAGPRSRKVKKPGEKTERVSTGEKRPRTAFSSEQLAR